MRLVNLTPHAITIYCVGEKIEIPSSGIVARVEQTFAPAGTISCDGKEIPLVVAGFGEIRDLPEPEDGVLYIVSLVVAQASRERDDLIVPDTSPEGVIRDENGRIIGTKRFLKVR